MSDSAESLNELGNDLKDSGRLAEAELAYIAATEAARWWSVPWYNLGLVHKLLRRWPDSARCNLRAVELDPDDGDAWWNLGIAATALSDWILARRAWRGCGIDLPDIADEPRIAYGLVPIRLHSESDGEVVWCDRIDPARAVIRNIPLPGSGYREGDLLLHDGAPNGYRLWNGNEYPVFDALQVLVPSDRDTYVATVEVAERRGIIVLEELSTNAGLAMEDWETTASICKQCSEGKPHVQHDHTVEAWKTKRRIAFAARSEADVAQVLESWTASVTDVRLLHIRCASV